MDIEAHRDLKLLEAVEADSRVTQRGLATRLGIALGLTNVYLRRLARKGYIKCVNVQSNRISYLITPRGIAEKARLTYEFMDYSLHLYREVRQHLSHRGGLARGDQRQGLAAFLQAGPPTVAVAVELDLGRPLQILGAGAGPHAQRRAGVEDLGRKAGEVDERIALHGVHPPGRLPRHGGSARRSNEV